MFQKREANIRFIWRTNFFPNNLWKFRIRFPYFLFCGSFSRKNAWIDLIGPFNSSLMPNSNKRSLKLIWHNLFSPERKRAEWWARKCTVRMRSENSECFGAPSEAEIRSTRRTRMKIVESIQFHILSNNLGKKHRTSMKSRLRRISAPNNLSNVL